MVSYLGYVEVNLRIPQFPEYEETILMLVTLEHQYIYGIQIHTIGTQVIKEVMQMVKEQNFNELTEAWGYTYISMVTVGQLALGETAEKVFNLSIVKGWIITSKEVTLSPFEMQTVSSVSKVTGHHKRVHVIEETREQSLSNEVVPTSNTVTLNLILVGLKFSCKI